MNRRIFLKLLGISPVIPSVLMAKASKNAESIKLLDKWIKTPGNGISPILSRTDICRPKYKGPTLGSSDMPDEFVVGDTNFYDGVYHKRSGTEFICKSRCNCFEQQIVGVRDKVMVICPNHAPYWLNDDGTTEDFVPTEFPKV